MALASDAAAAGSNAASGVGYPTQTPPIIGYVHCVCKSAPGEYVCAGMYFSLQQCTPQCASACHGLGAKFRMCMSSKELRWATLVFHKRYVPCENNVNAQAAANDLGAAGVAQ
eukprot:CAMPEP_0198538180 /NCGR_PEP_ID=MMETSP1462-20131121/46663_1 /TAXON_ID=1333877 /ORGANISM="Brandtodinium nutriculum, Strain RCC3387" /LENGTH=112 /DNA_ID=CAMNT_0044268197 /DNA_START=166 /DNA_END=501 /DNA_ORIENTATION=-